MKTESFVTLMVVLLVIVFGAIFSFVTIQNYKIELDMYKTMSLDQKFCLLTLPLSSFQKHIFLLDGMITKHKIDENTMTIYLNKLEKQSEESSKSLKRYTQMYFSVKEDFQHYFELYQNCCLAKKVDEQVKSIQKNSNGIVRRKE